MAKDRTREWLSGKGSKSVVPEYRLARPEYQEKYPTLWDFLSLQRIDDETRTVGTITLSVTDKGFVVTFNDRDNNRALFRTLDSLDGLLGALESILKKYPEDWREWENKKK